MSYVLLMPEGYPGEYVQDVDEGFRGTNDLQAATQYPTLEEAEARIRRANGFLRDAKIAKVEDCL